METVLLENCVKQYQILLTSLKQYLTSMYNDKLDYSELKHNLFSAIKMVNAVEEVMKVYNDKINNWAFYPYERFTL